MCGPRDIGAYTHHILPQGHFDTPNVLRLSGQILLNASPATKNWNLNSPNKAPVLIYVIINLFACQTFFIIRKNKTYYCHNLNNHYACFLSPIHLCFVVRCLHYFVYSSKSLLFLFFINQVFIWLRCLEWRLPCVCMGFFFLRRIAKSTTCFGIQAKFYWMLHLPRNRETWIVYKRQCLSWIHLKRLRKTKRSIA